MLKKNVDINDFIGVYDGFLNDLDVDNALKYFEEQNKLKKAFSRMQSENEGILFKKDEQVFLNETNVEVWLDDFKPLLVNFDTALRNYYSQTGFLNSITRDKNYTLSYTNLKIQKTQPSGGYHVWHVEKGPGFHNLKRALVYSIYLNDIEEGGETEFLHQKVRVSPKKGRIVIWPASFPYVHRGNPPLKKDKYIITSWLLF